MFNNKNIKTFKYSSAFISFCAFIVGIVACSTTYAYFSAQHTQNNIVSIDYIQHEYAIYDADKKKLIFYNNIDAPVVNETYNGYMYTIMSPIQIV